MIIYQYSRPDKFHLKNLKNRHLHFSKVPDLNDPFDSQIKADYRGTEEAWRLFYRKQQIKPETIDRHITLLKRIAESKGNTSNLLDLPVRSAFRESALLSCFSRKADSILMWSHYAMNHQGFVKGFETFKAANNIESIRVKRGQITYPGGGDDTHLSLFDVEYADEPPPTANGLTDTDYVMRFLKRKFTDWQYEAEVRAYLSMNWVKSTEIEYDARALKQVIFGLRMTTKDKRKIVDATRKGKHEGVEFYQCHEGEHKFAVTLEKLSI